MSPRWRCSLWRQCSHKSWKPSSLAEWLAQHFLVHHELLALTMIIAHQNGRDWVYNIRLEMVAVATDKCWVKISVEISRLFYIFWICRQQSMIMVEASNSSWTKNDFEIASFFPRGNVGANYYGLVRRWREDITTFLPSGRVMMMSYGGFAQHMS